MSEEFQLLLERVERLEQDVSMLKAQSPTRAEQPWWERIAGRFENDPTYDEIVRLGQEYRQSLRPKDD